MTQGDASAVVFLVDDDVAIRKALTRGLTAEGFSVRSFANAEDFLEEHDPEIPGCLVADVAMPGASGLELQRMLTASGCGRPIVFITGRGSIPMSVQAMRAGAVSFLPKPVHLTELVAAIREAFEKDRRIREQRAAHESINARLTLLTAREREVLDLVVAGKLNKQIAAELGAAEKTVKVHRGRVMAKLRVRSVAELVRLTSQAMSS
jgi:FixJ family two-component response regulator